MKRFFSILLLSLSLAVASTASAQQNDEPKGKAIINVFANFHTGLGSTNDDRGFEMDRSYFGYQYTFSNGLEFKAVLDVGPSKSIDDLDRVAYVKFAQVKWSTGRLTLNGGIINTTSFKTQQDVWGYRYMMKSFQDHYGFASGADLGLSAQYDFAPWISADVIVVNGEGYKRIQRLDGLQYGLGVTMRPLKGLILRLYGSLNEQVDEGADNSKVYTAFAGYECDAFSLGAEYSRVESVDGVAGRDMDGVSLFTTIKLGGRVDAFARYDDLHSRAGWNINKEESMLMAGVEIRPCKYVKISPNLRYNWAKAAGAKDKMMAYISCYFGF